MLDAFQKAPAEWKRTTLGEVVELGGGNIQTGPFGSQLHASDYVPVGIPSIMPVNIGDNRLIRDGIACVTEEDAQRLSRHLVRVGDIIYSRRGDVERRALVRDAEDGWLCGTGCLKVRLGDGIVLPEFAAFYLGHPEVREWIVRHAVGATMPNLNTGIMEAIPFLLPPMSDQKAIAETLGELDDKIEQNRRAGRTLEAMARATFKAWFVDFEPVRAKADGAKGYPGMPPAAFAALTDGFTDAPEELPQGWGSGKLGDYCEINRQSVRPGEIEGDIEYIDIASVTVGKLDDILPMPFSEAPSRARRRVRHGDTIWSCVRPNRRSYLFIHSPSENRIASTGFAVLSPNVFGASYLYELTTRQEFVEYLVANADGSAYPAVRPEHFARAEVVVPPSTLREAFEEVTMPLRDLIAAGEAESFKLAALRDYLLPRLLSGEARVSSSSEHLDEGV